MKRTYWDRVRDYRYDPYFPTFLLHAMWLAFWHKDGEYWH